MQIAPCKTAVIQLEKDLCRGIYKRERFVKTFAVIEDMKNMYGFYASSDIQLGLTQRKPFSKQKMKLYTAPMITCNVQNCVQELKIPKIFNIFVLLPAIIMQYL